MAGHPNALPSTPKATTTEWDLLQTFHYRTLLCTQVLKGNAAVWQSAVADIAAEVSDNAGLLTNLAGVKRNVSPIIHATVLLMLSQAFMKSVLAENPDISNAELVALMCPMQPRCMQGTLSMDTYRIQIPQAHPGLWRRHWVVVNLLGARGTSTEMEQHAPVQV